MKFTVPVSNMLLGNWSVTLLIHSSLSHLPITQIKWKATVVCNTGQFNQHVGGIHKSCSAAHTCSSVTDPARLSSIICTTRFCVAVLVCRVVWASLARAVFPMPEYRGVVGKQSFSRLLNLEVRWL